MTYQFIDVPTLKADLKRNVAEIIYTKSDGSSRRMRCTLMQKYTSMAPLSENTVFQDTTSEELADEKHLKVFDTERKCWRTFSTDLVISCQAINTE